MNDEPDRQPAEDMEASAVEAGLDDERREALKALCTFAAYTTPAVTILLVSQRATAQSITIPPPPPPPGFSAR